MPFELGHKRVGGRTKGTPNRASAARQAEIAASGVTPLEYMLGVLRDETASREDRKWAAQNAAPYIHPRLSSTHAAISGEPSVRAWLQSLGEPET